MGISLGSTARISAVGASNRGFTCAVHRWQPQLKRRRCSAKGCSPYSRLARPWLCRAARGGTSPAQTRGRPQTAGAAGPAGRSSCGGGQGGCGTTQSVSGLAMCKGIGWTQGPSAAQCEHEARAGCSLTAPQKRAALACMSSRQATPAGSPPCPPRPPPHRMRMKPPMSAGAMLSAWYPLTAASLARPA